MTSETSIVQLTRLHSYQLSPGQAFLLGPWCVPKAVPPWSFSQLRLHNGQKALLPYHWDDVRKLQTDHAYLSDLLQRIRFELRSILNELHETKQSQRYWNILCSWWLTFFTHVYWDRWESIRAASDRLLQPAFEIYDHPNKDAPPLTKTGFVESFADDHWNQILFQKIAQTEFQWVPIHPVGPMRQEHMLLPHPSLPKKAPSPAPKLGMNGMRNVPNFGFGNRQDVAFLSDHFRQIDRIKICLRLGQVPNPQETARLKEPELSETMRSWKFTFPTSRFEQALADAIVANMPTSYLEGYDNLLEAASQLPWPRSPRLIVTADGHYTSDLFGIYAAQHVANGASLTAIQHGGTYGIAKLHTSTDHDQLVADAVLSWGWTSHKTTPAPAVKLLNLRRWRLPRRGKALLVVSADLGRYSHHISSASRPTQKYREHTDIAQLLELLPESIREKTRLRMLQAPGDLDSERHLLSRFPSVAASEMRTPFKIDIEKSRLVLCTDNSTTFIESMYLNTPTVIYWNPAFNVLTRIGDVAMERLQYTGVFHSTPESVARHIALVWADPHKWWNDQATQEAVKDFLEEFGHVGMHPHKAWAKVLRHLGHQNIREH